MWNGLGLGVFIALQAAVFVEAWTLTSMLVGLTDSRLLDTELQADERHTAPVVRRADKAGVRSSLEISAFIHPSDAG